MNTEWRGDLADDCTVDRYGMTARAEQMFRGHWWMAVYRGSEQLFSTAECTELVPKLTTGKMARAAADCLLEYIAHQANAPDAQQASEGK